MKRLLIFAAAALAGCSSLQSPESLLNAPQHVGPGSSPAPNVAWVPPASAVPPPVEKQITVTLPPDVQPGATITLAQAIDVALSNNPDTRAAWFSTRAAEAALGSRRSAYLPEIDLGGTLARGRTQSSAPAETTFGPSLTLTYLLFDFGGRAAQVEEARQSLIATAFSQNQTIQNVVLRTQQAYYGYLDAKALVAAQTATVKERQTALDAADARHSSGVATIADVLQARTAFSQAQLSLETFEGALRSAEGTLSNAMGLPPTTRFAAGDLPTDLPIDTVSSSVDKLIDQAMATRPDLAASRAAVLNTRARVQEVRAQGLPTVGLSSSVGRSFLFSPGSSSLTTYSAGVGVRIPVFTGFRNSYDIRQAEAIAAATQEDARGLADLVGLEVWNSYYALQTATQRVRTSRDLLASAQQSVDVESGRYKAGVGSIIDLLTAEAALENARAQEVQSRADWLVAVAQLAHDTGSLVPPAAQGK